MKSLLLMFLVAHISFAQGLITKNIQINLEPKYTVQNSAPLIFPNETLNKPEGKSPALAVIYSLLLPGMGELYVGDYSQGKYHTIAEGLLWITLIGFDSYGRWIRDDARNFSVQHAGVSRAGKGDRFFVDIGNFYNVREYNDEMLRLRLPYKRYDDPLYAWSWDSKQNWDHYRDLRINSDQMFNNINFVAAAIGINHLVSAINAGLLAKSYNNNLDRFGSIDIHANVIGDISHANGIMISFSKTF